MNEIIMMELIPQYQWVPFVLLAMTGALLLIGLFVGRMKYINITGVLAAIILVVFLLSIYIITLDRNKEVKQYHTVCHQVDGKTYCTIKGRGTIEDY